MQCSSLFDVCDFQASLCLIIFTWDAGSIIITDVCHKSVAYLHSNLYFVFVGVIHRLHPILKMFCCCVCLSKCWFMEAIIYCGCPLSNCSLLVGKLYLVTVCGISVIGCNLCVSSSCYAKTSDLSWNIILFCASEYIFCNASIWFFKKKFITR